MKKFLIAVLALIMALVSLGCSNKQKEAYESALQYAAENDYLIAYELLEDCLDYKDSEYWYNEYKYAYAMDLLGFSDQFSNPKIQDMYDLELFTINMWRTTGNEYYIIEKNYLEAYKEARVLLYELQESGYGKNVDYLIEIVEPEIVRGENLK